MTDGNENRLQMIKDRVAQGKRTRRREELTAVVEAKKPIVRRIGYSFPNALELAETEQEILDAIELKGGETIIGLLVLGEEIVEKSKRAAQTALRGNPNLIPDLFQQYPGTLCLVICYAIGEMENHEFWAQIEDCLATKIGQRRRLFSNEFSLAVKSLGLVTHYDSTGSGAYKWLQPCIFQAGFTPYMVDKFPIIFGGRQLLPSPDDREGVRAFCLDQAMRPQIVGNLRHVLRGPSGVYVVSAVLRAFLDDDYDSLPSHFRGIVREVFSGIEKDSLLHRPYLEWDRQLGGPAVVFPPLPRSLRNAYKEWQLADGTCVNLFAEGRLAVSHFNEDWITGGLMKRTPDAATFEFKLKIKPDSEDPVLFFDAQKYRRIVPSAIEETETEKHLELPAGDYLLWTLDPCTTNMEEDFEEWDCGYVAKAEVSYKFDPIEAEADDKVCHYRAKHRASLWISESRRIITETMDRVPVYSEELPNIRALLPVRDGHGKVSAKVKITVQGFSKDLEINESLETAQLIVEKDLEFHVSGILSELNPGLYLVTISLQHSGYKVNRRFYVWKGLRYLSAVDGFVCSEAPTNFDASKSSGFSCDHSDKRRLKWSRGSSRMIVCFGAVTAAFAAPGVHARLLDSDAEVPSSLSLPEISVETICFTCDDMDEWQIVSGKTVIITLGGSLRRKHVIKFSELAAQFGCVGKVKAIRRRDQEEVVIFNYNCQRVARAFKYEWNSGWRHFYANVTLSLDHAPAIRAVRTNLLKELDPEELPWIDLTLGEREDVIQYDLGNWKLEVRVGPSRNGNGGYEDCATVRFQAQTQEEEFCDMLQLEIRTPEGDVQPLLVPDKWNPSEGLLFFSNKPMSHPLPDIPLKHLDRYLRLKFHHDVWTEVKYFRRQFEESFRDEWTCAASDRKKELLALGIDGLIYRSESKLSSMVNSLAVAAELTTLTSPSNDFPKFVDPGLIRSPMQMIAELGEVSVYDFLCRHFGLDLGEIPERFKDVVAVSMRQADHLGSFDCSNWLSSLKKYDPPSVWPKRFEQSEHKVLSFMHLGICLDKVAQRFQICFGQETLQEQSPLLGIRQEYLEIVASSRIRWNWVPAQFLLVDEEKFIPDELWGFNSSVTALANAAFYTASVMRLRAHDIIGPTEFTELLQRILGARGEEESTCKRLAFLLNLAPELFAFSLLFWELSLA